MSASTRTLTQLLLVIAISLAGAVAVVCFILSLLPEPGAAEGFRTVAYVAAGICAVLGVSIAVFASRR